MKLLDEFYKKDRKQYFKILYNYGSILFDKKELKVMKKGDEFDNEEFGDIISSLMKKYKRSKKL